jgi:hypothetical protein
MALDAYVKAGLGLALIPEHLVHVWIPSRSSHSSRCSWCRQRVRDKFRVHRFACTLVSGRILLAIIVIFVDFHTRHPAHIRNVSKLEHMTSVRQTFRTFFKSDKISPNTLVTTRSSSSTSLDFDISLLYRQPNQVQLPICLFYQHR